MNMANRYLFPIQGRIIFVVMLGFVLFLNGAVPFLAAPTLGQAVWLVGFSQAFSLDHMSTIYSSYVGYPSSMWIPFGLPVAYPAGFLISMGMQAIDAYSAIVAGWFFLAFWGASRYARWLGVGPILSALAATLWMSLPVVWAHAGYSTLSVGIALLPFYLYVASRLFSEPCGRKNWMPRRLLAYWLVCVVSLFMDGYSFMMFMTGASLILSYFFLSARHLRGYLAKVAIPAHVIGLGLAYSFYIAYIGKLSFDVPSLDFFRGWGVDLTFWTIPTRGVLWFWDILGLSVARSSRQYFGDSSVWNTTFLLPLIVAGSLAWWAVRRRRKFAYGLVVLVLFGLYMALGPSLKIDSVKPSDMGPSMPVQYSIGPTGSAILSQNVPGFKSMRAAYRWTALGSVGLWALLILWTGTKESLKKRVWIGGLFLVLIIINMPHLEKKWALNERDRNSFSLMGHDLIRPMSQDLRRGELVAFLPFRNDFLINYLAPKLQIRTYNVGGDKQLAFAEAHWPATMQNFLLGVIDRRFAGWAVLLLARHQADVVVLPYIDLLWAAHRWPYPIEYKNSLAPIIEDLRESGLVNIVERKYYATVRLNNQAKTLIEQHRIYAWIENRWCINGRCLYQRGFSDSALSQVGHLDGNTLTTNGETGFLAFGPYAFMKAGHYRLRLFGKAKTVESAWCDVVSNKGSTEYGKFRLVANRDTNVLADGVFVLDKDVQDMEVRVYVDKIDTVSLQGYELTPVAGRKDVDGTTAS